MNRLIGKKVWVIQYDDDDNSVYGTVDAIGDGFIAIKVDQDPDPTIYVNLRGVKEIEVYREREREGELRLLHFPTDRDKGPPKERH